VFLGDGAEWIWKLARDQFSDARQILDFYHASEHVWEIARGVFGEGNEAGKQWAETEADGLSPLSRGGDDDRQRAGRSGVQVGGGRQTEGDGDALERQRRGRD